MLKSSKSKKVIVVFRWVLGIPLITLSLYGVIEDYNFKEKLLALGILILGLLLLPFVFRFVRKNIAILTLSVIALLLIFNPGLTAFKNYSIEITDARQTLYKREANYLLFSFYQKQWRGREDMQEDLAEIYTENYIGILGNFYPWQ
jgi:hypothetical protein